MTSTATDVGYVYLVVDPAGGTPEHLTEWGKPQRHDPNMILLALVTRDGPGGTIRTDDVFTPKRSEYRIIEERLNNPQPAPTPANRADRRARKHRR